METLATVVFARTPKGAVAIKSNSDEVPRRLRTLLLAIDGRSPVGQYVPFLTAFAPLSEKFVELEQMGFVKRNSSAAFVATAHLETAVQNNNASGFGVQVQRMNSAMPKSGLMPINEFDLLALAAAPAFEHVSNSPNAFERELQALAAQMSVTAVAQDPPQGNMPSAFAPKPLKPDTVKPVLADLLHEMDKFLSQSAGADALPISLMLEQIKTLAQLRLELPQYYELVRRYGSAAEPHIQRLAVMLDKAET